MWRKIKRGIGLVNSVSQYSDLTPKTFYEIISEYNSEILLTDDWIQKKQNSKYATLLKFEKITKLKNKLEFSQNGQLSWIVLNTDYKFYTLLLENRIY